VTREQTETAWTTGNRAGDGYDPNDEHGGDAIDDCDELVAALVADGWTLVHRADSTDEIAVLEAGGRVIGIGGDGAGRGPWAVVLDDGTDGREVAGG